jgi:putative heme iron utilization protein
MKHEAAARAAQLLHDCRAAALGTVSDGAPRVSATPFAVLPEPFAFVVLVSGLSAHTRDMLADPRVALLAAEPERPDANVHALARVSIQGEARPLPAGDALYSAARARYETRFPEMRALFDLGDFVLFGIRPTSVRVVSGFAQAASVTPDSLAAAVARIA